MTDTAAFFETDFIALTADVVSAYVANNKVEASTLPGLIAEVHGAIAKLGQAPAAPVVEAKLSPAVPVKKSVTPDYIICLEDGKKFKSLKRHLSSSYGMTPTEYRNKWGLAADYPMVAPNYAEARSQLAKKMGLGSRAKVAKAAQAAKTPKPTKAKGTRKAA